MLSLTHAGVWQSNCIGGLLNGGADAVSAPGVGVNAISSQTMRLKRPASNRGCSHLRDLLPPMGAVVRFGLKGCQSIQQQTYIAPASPALRLQLTCCCLLLIEASAGRFPYISVPRSPPSLKDCGWSWTITHTT